MLCVPTGIQCSRGVVAGETREGGWLPCKEIFLQKTSPEGGENKGQETTPRRLTERLQVRKEKIVRH